jgi:hypothetical protein
MNESEVYWLKGMVHSMLIIDSARTHLFVEHQNMAPCLTTNWAITNSKLPGNMEKIVQYQIFF